MAWRRIGLARHLSFIFAPLFLHFSLPFLTIVFPCQVSAAETSHNFDTAAFYRMFVATIRDVQVRNNTCVLICSSFRHIHFSLTVSPSLPLHCRFPLLQGPDGSIPSFVPNCDEEGFPLVYCNRLQTNSRLKSACTPTHKHILPLSRTRPLALYRSWTRPADPSWGTALLTIAYQVYSDTGNLAFLREVWPSLLVPALYLLLSLSFLPLA